MNKTKLFTISDLAKRKVCLLFDPEKHNIEQLHFVLSIAFPSDPIKPSGHAKRHFYASILPGTWQVNIDMPVLPVQSLELFQAD